MTAKPTQKPARPAARSAAQSATAPATHAHAAQEVRIMGGQWKRTPLPVADLPGLRPTPGRVRETLFNWLGQDLSGWRCVDAFAGSGALGLEAASRGAAEVLLIEHNAQLVDALRSVLLRLKAQQVKLERTDALVALRRLAGQGWDVVFLDPPFLQGDNDTLCLHALAAAAQAVAPTGRVYLESPRVWSDDELVALGLVALKRGRAGAVHYSLLQPLPAATAASPTESDTPAGA